MLGGDWGEVRIQNHHNKTQLAFDFQKHIELKLIFQVDVGASSEGGEVWGGSAQLLGLRPSTQYEVILLIVMDGGRWMNETWLMLLYTRSIR